MHLQDTAQLQLGGHQRSSQIHWALIDAADLEWANQWRWSYINGYATRMDRATRRLARLHRALLGLVPGDGWETDHINRDKLDNRRCNLRVVTHQTNLQNVDAKSASESGLRGVRWATNARKWQAYAHVDGRFHHLGVYEDKDDAAAVARMFRLAHMAGATD
jgi:hypothetical protein